jgi:tetratricopeptide (TPR) repeat protein
MMRPLYIALLAMVVMTAGAVVEAQTTRERGLGPFELTTRRGDVTVRLLRREGDMIWVDRQVRSGEFIETGIPAREVIAFRSPPPRLFAVAEQAATPEQIGAVIDQLRRYVAQFRAYRDLPGIPVNEALLKMAQLNERREFWRDALVIYRELMEQPYDFPGKDMIRYQAGLNLRRMNQCEAALEYLLDDPVPDTDLDVMSTILHARAECLAAAGRAREAVDTYLQLIVFYPYIAGNEVRALAGIVPQFVALQDWDAAVKALEALRRDYAEAEETVATEILLAKYAEQVEREKQFQVIED